MKKRLMYILLVGIIVAPQFGCSSLQQVLNLRLVDFSFAGIVNPRLAGIDLSQVRSLNDLNPLDVIRATQILRSGEVPISFTFNVGANNPQSNNVDARMVHMDWTLFLEERQTISGVLDQDILMRPGDQVTIPVEISLDLRQFFEQSGPDLFELALNLLGQGGSPKQVRLAARPTINTALGPIQYPREVSIVNTQVGR